VGGEFIRNDTPSAGLALGGWNFPWFKGGREAGCKYQQMGWDRECLFDVKTKQEKGRTRVGMGVERERAGGGWRKSEFIRKEGERKNDY
jgi:hypothetical protein